MDLWFSEFHSKTVKLSIKVETQLYNESSNYQDIAVLKTKEFGNILTLDGVIMLTERDEFIYHEMITHIPMAVNQNIKKVLVIGAGDGGVARELSKYKTIESIDIVEIDEQVVKVCKEFLPQTAIGFEDERVNLIFKDGLKFVRKKDNEYDLIIVDSTDPSGPGEVLFTKEFYGNCYKALKDDGIMINQHESPFYKEDAKAMNFAHKRIVQSFKMSRVYQAHIPTYPSGHWLFGFSSKKYHPIRDLKAKEWNDLKIKTNYYNTNLHVGSFYLPTYVEEMLKDNE